MNTIKLKGTYKQRHYKKHVQVKKKRIWLVKQAVYYAADKVIVFSCKTKKLAYAVCRQDGYKYNKEDDLFLYENHPSGNSMYRQIVPLDYYEEVK